MGGMTIGSLFSGIGGLELGLEWAGVGHTVWQVEQDDYCRRVLAKHWPDAVRFTDVREVGAQNLPAVDVLCGGFPCQDISYAGKGAGLAGARSGLWYEFARIVRELGPEYVVVENVRALLTRGLDAVLGTLADCGYDAEWSVLSAADVGAPHLRERLFILANAQRWRPQSERVAGIIRGATPAAEGEVHERERSGYAAHRRREDVADASGSGCRAREWELHAGESDALRSGADLSDAASERRGEARAHRLHGQEKRTAGGGWPRGEWATEPDVGRVAHGIPARVDRLRALGNAVVPHVAEVVGRRLLELHADRMESVA